MILDQDYFLTLTIFEVPRGGPAHAYSFPLIMPDLILLDNEEICRSRPLSKSFARVLHNHTVLLSLGYHDRHEAFRAFRQHGELPPTFGFGWNETNLRVHRIFVESCSFWIPFAAQVEVIASIEPTEIDIGGLV